MLEIVKAIQAVIHVVEKVLEQLEKSIAMGKRSFGGSYVSRKRNKAGYKPYKKKLVFHGPVRPRSLGNAGQASDKLLLKCQ